MTSETKISIKKPIIDPEYIPEGKTSDEFLKFLRIDFEKKLRDELPSYEKDTWEGRLTMCAKMFLKRRGFPVSLVKDPEEDMTEIVNYLFDIGREIVEEELGRKEAAMEMEKEHERRTSEATRAAKDQRSHADELGISDEELQSQSGETPEAAYLRMQERKLK